MAEARVAVDAEAFLKTPLLRLNLFDIHGHPHDVPAAAGEDARDRADIAEVAAVGDGDVFLGGLDIVCGVKINPPGAGRKN